MPSDRLSTACFRIAFCPSLVRLRIQVSYIGEPSSLQEHLRQRTGAQVVLGDPLPKFQRNANSCCHICNKDNHCDSADCTNARKNIAKFFLGYRQKLQHMGITQLRSVCDNGSWMEEYIEGVKDLFDGNVVRQQRFVRSQLVAALKDVPSESFIGKCEECSWMNTRNANMFRAINFSHHIAKSDTLNVSVVGVVGMLHSETCVPFSIPSMLKNNGYTPVSSSEWNTISLGVLSGTASLVQVFSKDGKYIIILGTNHLSRTMPLEVKSIIDSTKPQYVMLELDRDRWNNYPIRLTHRDMMELDVARDEGSEHHNAWDFEACESNIQLCQKCMNHSVLNSEWNWIDISGEDCSQFIVDRERLFDSTQKCAGAVK